jgi:putative membrane protein
MFYKDRIFWGMHLIWWVIWFGLLGWIFFATFGVPNQDEWEDDPLSIHNKRFAKGEITKDQYEKSKKLLKSDGRI